MKYTTNPTVQAVAVGTATAGAGVLIQRSFVDDAVVDGTNFIFNGDEGTARFVGGLIVAGVTVGAGYWALQNGYGYDGMMASVGIPIGLALAIASMV